MAEPTWNRTLAPVTRPTPLTLLPDVVTIEYVDDLVDELRSLSPADRDARLAAVHDPEVAREARALLEAHAAAAPAPRMLERYELLDLIGRGATAEVWRARDTSLDREVALKLFDLSRCAGDEDRAIDEARAVCRVLHDNVIRVYDAGRFGATGFLCMEICDMQGPGGATVLAQSLDRARPTDPLEAARLVAQAARGVAAAHRKRVYHRDLKPANILRLPGDDRVKVIDWGLATRSLRRSEGPAGETVSIVIDDGRRVVVGTLPYMAPEQARGVVPDVDRGADREILERIDVFGLGATLWDLLSGRAPYGARPQCAECTPAGLCRTCLAILLKQASDGSVPPLHGAVPPRLAAIVMRAVAADPADRHPSADALAEDLEGFLADRVVSTDAPSRALAARLWTRRNPAIVRTIAVSGAVVAIAVAIVGGLLWETSVDLARVQEERDAAAQDLDRAMAHLATTKGELEDRRAELDHLKGEDTTVRAKLAESTDALGETSRTLVKTKTELSDTRVSLQAEQAARAAERDAANRSIEAEKAAREQAEAARAKADAARRDAEDARAKADQDRREAEDARRDAEDARAKAEADKADAEEARRKAEDAQKHAEEARRKAEDAQRRAEAARRVAEDARKDAEAQLDDLKKKLGGTP
jgi:serine/threonine-protein kinase